MLVKVADHMNAYKTRKIYVVKLFEILFTLIQKHKKLLWIKEMTNCRTIHIYFIDLPILFIYRRLFINFFEILFTLIQKHKKLLWIKEMTNCRTTAAP
jgi:hypothetical protein